MEQSEGKCGHCRSAIGTTSRAYIYCQKEKMQVLRDSKRQCFIREPGADDDIGDEK
jgi:hypothetical protein